MIVPTVHLNGTSREALLDQVCKVTDSLYDTIAAMSNAWPHGRDYYPQGPAAIRTAESDHRAALTAVRKILNEYEELALAIADSGIGGGSKP